MISPFSKIQGLMPVLISSDKSTTQTLARSLYLSEIHKACLLVVTQRSLINLLDKNPVTMKTGIVFYINHKF